MYNKSIKNNKTRLDGDGVRWLVIPTPLDLVEGVDVDGLAVVGESFLQKKNVNIQNICLHSSLIQGLDHNGRCPQKSGKSPVTPYDIIISNECSKILT